jgi:hypothetical protein
MAVMTNELEPAAGAEQHGQAISPLDQGRCTSPATSLSTEMAAMPAMPPVTVRFEVRADALHDLARVVDLRSNSSEPNPDPVTITVTPESMTLEASRRTVVCRVRAGLNPAPDRHDRATATFWLPHLQLEGLGRAFNGSLRCEVDPVQEEFRISQKRGRFVLPAAVVQRPSGWPAVDGAKPVKCDPRLLAKALRFVGSLARVNRAQPEFSVVQVADSRCTGGVPHELAMFESNGLDGLELRVAAEDTSLLAKILTHLNPANTTVVQDADWQIIGDGIIQCSIAKPMHRFPPVDMILKATPEHRFFATKHDLALQLQYLAPLHAVRRGRAWLEVRYDPGEIGKLRMHAHNSAVGVGQTTLNVWPIDEREPTDGFEMTVPLAPLARVVAGTWDPKQRVEFGVFEGKTLLLTEEHEGEGYRTRAYVAARAPAIP